MMMKYRRRLSILFIFLIGLIGVTLYYLLFIRDEKTISNAPIATPTTHEERLLLVDVYPKEGKSEIITPNTSVVLYFSEDLLPTSIKVEVLPKIAIEYKVNEDFPSRLIIRPRDKWVFNEKYSFVVDAQSTKGSKLLNPILYSFTPIKVTEIQAIE